MYFLFFCGTVCIVRFKCNELLFLRYSGIKRRTNHKNVIKKKYLTKKSSFKKRKIVKKIIDNYNLFYPETSFSTSIFIVGTSSKCYCYFVCALGCCLISISVYSLFVGFNFYSFAVNLDFY